MESVKRRFPLIMAPAPRGWHLLICLENGKSERLIKAGRNAEKAIPFLFNSQQDAWIYLKELFIFFRKPLVSEEPNTEKLKNCKQCDRIYRVRNTEYCPLCIKANEFMLEQIWLGFALPTDRDFSMPQKVTVMLQTSEDEFIQIPELFKTLVQQQIAEEEELENRQPSVEQRLNKIIKSRVRKPLARKAH